MEGSREPLLSLVRVSQSLLWATYTSSIVTYPLDVLRRRMQMRGQMGDRYPYHNSMHAVITIYRVEGVGGFYKGMLPNLLKVAPLVAITFITYEFTKARLFGVPLNWR